MKAEKLMDLEEVYQAALRAKESGSTRFCMGAAWRGPSQAGALSPAPCHHAAFLTFRNRIVVEALAGNGRWPVLWCAVRWGIAELLLLAQWAILACPEQHV